MNVDNEQQIQADKEILNQPTEITLKDWETNAPIEVRKYCANYDRQYGCLFKLRCTMIDETPSCDYFDKSIVPILNKKRVKKYRKRTPKNQRYCKECGMPVGKKRQYCQDCAKDRRKRQVRKKVKELRKERKNKDWM